MNSDTMRLPILIESLADGRYRARIGEPFSMTADGPTAQDARTSLEHAVAANLRKGFQFSSIDVPAMAPLAIHRMPGWLPDDRVTEEWLAIIEEQRQQADIEAGLS